MHHANGLLFWIVHFIIAVLVGWITLSVILIWTQPILYNADGSVNWVTTLWVATLIILFAWLFRLLVQWMINLFWNRCDPCASKGVEDWMF